MRTGKRSNGRSNGQQNEFYSASGRKIPDYDWKYGVKHIPIWKTNQLLNNDLVIAKDLSSAVNSQYKDQPKEELKLSAKRVNIYHLKPEVNIYHLCI